MYMCDTCIFFRIVLNAPLHAAQSVALFPTAPVFMCGHRAPNKSENEHDIKIQQKNQTIANNAITKLYHFHNKDDDE